MSFVIDAYARRILGWKVSESIATNLVLDAFNQAIFTPHREGVKDLSRSIHHNGFAEVRVKPGIVTWACADRSPRRFSAYVRCSVVCVRRVLTSVKGVAGIDVSIGTVGDAHNNSLVESINWLHKAELIKPRRSWRNAEQSFCRGRSVSRSAIKIRGISQK